MKKILLAVLTSLLVNSSASAAEKCTVNVLNSFCLGGSLKGYIKEHKELNIVNDKENSNVKVIRINGFSKKPSDIKILTDLKYKNVNTVTLKSFNDKIFQIYIQYDNSDEIGHFSNNNELDTLRLATDLATKYGQGHPLDGNNQDFWMLTWQLKSYGIALSCSQNTFCNLNYTLSEILNKTLNNNGL